MAEIVDRHAADIHPDMSRRDGLKIYLRPGQSIKNFQEFTMLDSSPRELLQLLAFYGNDQQLHYCPIAGSRLGPCRASRRADPGPAIGRPAREPHGLNAWSPHGPLGLTRIDRSA